MLGDLGARGFECFCASCSDCDVGAGCSEVQCDGAADTAATTDDQNAVLAPVPEVEGHVEVSKRMGQSDTVEVT